MPRHLIVKCAERGMLICLAASYLLLCIPGLMVTDIHAALSDPVEFDEARLVNGTKTEPESFIVADVNKDGKDDLVITGNTGETIEILISQEDGNFKSAGILRVNPASFVGKPLVMDMNRDGNLDIVVLSQTKTGEGGQLHVFPGSGTGTFTLPATVIPCSADEIYIADFTSDGIPDVLAITRDKSITDRDSSALTILPGKGDGTFGNGIAGPSDLRGLALLAINDFNQDGKQDIAVGEDVREPIRVFTGKGDGTFNVTSTPGWSTPVSSGAATALAEPVFAIATQDLNKDGVPDLVVGGASSMWTLLGKGDGTFNIKSHIAKALTYNLLLIKDLNGDGKLDVLTNNAAAGVSDRICFFKGEGNGDLASAWDVPTRDLFQYRVPQPIRVLSSTAYVRTRAMGRYGVHVQRSTGPYTFSYTGANPHYVVSGDFNGDGRPDLAALGMNLSGSRKKVVLMPNITGVPVYQRYSWTVFAAGGVAIALLAAAAGFCLWFFKPPPLAAADNGRGSTHVPFPVTPRPAPSRYSE